jgi:demethylmenaquinone methyltransferase/2-methoxy-6-polyprenyl-1,4-benzoquinol methylase
MSDILQQQIAYYRARAGEYDEWFYRLGRYDRGEELNRIWFDEVALLMREVQALGQIERALELAAGTGNWTKELVKISDHVTAVDASPEVLAINREKIAQRDSDSPLPEGEGLGVRVQYVQADLFTWQPDTQYDLIFMAFWMSHVPPDKFDSFMAMVGRATKPGGQIFMIDSLPDGTSTAANHIQYQPEKIYHTRKLNDGREFKIIKVFYEPHTLENQLATQGFEAQVRSTGRYFWWAKGTLQERPKA